jgi:hypothetical protein
MAAKRKTWKNGDKFRVNTAHSVYVLGCVYTVNGVNADNLCGMDGNGNNIGQWIPKAYVIRYDNTKADLEAERSDLQVRLDDVNAKLAFLAENNLDNYDEHEFRVYQALTVLDSTTDKLERAKKLAALMKDLN